MGFWIFMLSIVLIIPLTIVGFGEFFDKNPPKEVNDIFGYRTSMSMKNKDTWDFVHHYCGKLWIRMGLVMLFLSIVIMLLIIRESTNYLTYIGYSLCGMQFIFVIGSIYSTEKALKRNYDIQGDSKNLNS